MADDQVTENSSAEALEALKADTPEVAEAPERAVEVRDQSFKIVTALPGIVLLDLGVASDPAATQGEQMRALREFIKFAIEPSDAGRFDNFLRTANPIIEIDELNEVVEKMMAVIGGRPTE